MTASKPECKYLTLRAIAYTVATKAPKSYPPDLLQRLVEEIERVTKENDHGTDN